MSLDEVNFHYLRRSEATARYILRQLKLLCKAAQLAKQQLEKTTPRDTVLNNVSWSIVRSLFKSYVPTCIMHALYRIWKVNNGKSLVSDFVPST